MTTSRGAIDVRFNSPSGEIVYHWTVEADRVHVSVEVPPKVTRVSLPGPFQPDCDEWDLALPLYQGCSFRASGKRWEQAAIHGGHANFSTAMAATVASAGSLVVTHASHSNWQAVYGEDESGLYVTFDHQRCPVDGFRGAEVELYPVDPGISAVYKAYRRVLKQRGNFVSWEEKIGRKPILEKIFGALVAFIGYNHASEIDYAGSVRALSSAGFERILLLPVRMCHSSLDFLMGKEPLIWLSDETIRNLQTIDEVMVSPWMWMFEGYDDGSPDIRSKYRVHENGPQVRWQIDEHRWSEICTAYQIQDIRERLSSDMGAMDWLHFDVNSNYSGRPYLSTDHTLHGNHRIGTMADVDLTR